MNCPNCKCEYFVQGGLQASLLPDNVPIPIAICLNCGINFAVSKTFYDDLPSKIPNNIKSFLNQERD